MNNQLRTVSMAIALLLSVGGVACVHGARGARARNGGSQNSIAARQNGYEFAYQDGAERGRQDRERMNPVYRLDSADYRNADRGYTRSMGDRRQYQQGYREGYKAGYDEAYRDRAESHEGAPPRRDR
jgi:hypothetical protein